MSPERARELLPIIQARAEGKEIEYQNLDGAWRDNRDMDINGKWKYRVKPSSELVPWTPADVPLTCWLRSKHRSKHDPTRSLVIHISNDGVAIAPRGEHLSYQFMLGHFEWLHPIGDVDTWLPCGKEAE